MDMSINAQIARTSARSVRRGGAVSVRSVEQLDHLIKTSEVVSGRAGRVVFLGNTWRRSYRVTLQVGGYEMTMVDERGQESLAWFVTRQAMECELLASDIWTKQFAG